MYFSPTCMYFFNNKINKVMEVYSLPSSLSKKKIVLGIIYILID